jgi:hypothetical protein
MAAGRSPSNDSDDAEYDLDYIKLDRDIDDECVFFEWTFQSSFFERDCGAVEVPQWVLINCWMECGEDFEPWLSL